MEGEKEYGEEDKKKRKSVMCYNRLEFALFRKIFYLCMIFINNFFRIYK